MRKRSMIFPASLCAIFLLCSGEPGPQFKAKSIEGIKAPARGALKIDTDYGKMPLYFIPNRGQLDKQVAYYVQGKDKTLYFTPGGITFALTKAVTASGRGPKSSRRGMLHNLRDDEIEAQLDDAKEERTNPDNSQKNGPIGSAGASSDSDLGKTYERWAVRLDFVGANKDVRPKGEEETGAVVSYFKGKPSDWRAGLPTYSKIRYRDLWPGIDLIYYGTVNKLKYEFIVHPGADPSTIRLVYWGVDKVWVDENGRLQVMTPAGGFSDDVPAAYQEINGERVEVPLAYRLSVNGARGAGKNAAAGSAGQEFVYGFEVGDYDRSRPVVLDPCILTYCGYIGGAFDDLGRGIAVDGSGNAYVTGDTSSTEATFPEIVGPDLTYNGGNLDAFVAKVNLTGTSLIYCGYVGGSGEEYGRGIAVDGSGNAYVTGMTDSSEATFPVAVGPDLSYNGGSEDAFVAKISYWDVWAAKHAVGDFDGDGTNEVAVDFGAAGAWMYDSGSWTQLAPENPENLVPFDIDGNGDDEIAADLGPLGLWLWNAGVWNQLSGINVEGMAVGDVDADGADEVVCDFGALGIWVYNGGSWTQLSGADADYVITADVDKTGTAEIAADFGNIGLWIWKSGAWTQISGVNPDYLAVGELIGSKYLLCDFGASGLWVWTELGNWTQLSGANADYMITADTDVEYPDEIFADFSSLGLWLWTSAVWSEPSGMDAEYMIAADVTGDGSDEIAVDFGAAGLWVWNNGPWTLLTPVSPEYLLSADTNGDGAKEILADFGASGLWMWNGAWTQISEDNPD